MTHWYHLIWWISQYKSKSQSITFFFERKRESNALEPSTLESHDIIILPFLYKHFAMNSEPAVNPPQVSSSLLPTPKKLIWKSDKELKIFLTEAQEKANQVISDSDVALLHFKDFGTDDIKKIGKETLF